MCAALAGMWLMAATLKLADSRAFLNEMLGYVGPWYVESAALVIALEMTLGAALLFRRAVAVCLTLSFVTLLVFTLVDLHAASGTACHCFGAVTPSWTFSQAPVLRNCALLLVNAALILAHFQRFSNRTAAA